MRRLGGLVKSFSTDEEIYRGLRELDLRAPQWAIARAWTVEYWQSANHEPGRKYRVLKFKDAKGWVYHMISDGVE